MTGLQLGILYFQIALSCTTASCFNTHYQRAMHKLECTPTFSAHEGMWKDFSQPIEEFESCIEKFK